MCESETWTLRKAEQDTLERTEMRMLRCMMGITRIEKSGTEEIRARAGVANISETIRAASTEEDVVMRTWNIEMNGRRKITCYLCPGTIRVVGARTTADIGDNLELPSLAVFGYSLTAVEVETGPLSDVVFPSFLLPSSFSFPWYCALYDLLQRRLDLITCPNHRNFLFFTVVSISS